ncbi:inner membrane protein yjeH, partial [Vibrio parahaemolyticus V-223/04]
GTSSKQSTG